MHSVFCFSQVIMSSCRVMWIYWCLWIVLIIQSCNGNGDQNFTIAKMGSDTLNVSEGANVTMTCSYTINFGQLRITKGNVVFDWFENLRSDEINANNYRNTGAFKLRKYNLASDDDRFDVDSSGGSTRFIERNGNSSSLTIQNVQSVHDGPYVCAIFTEAVPGSNPIIAADQITLSIYVEPELKNNVKENWTAENNSATVPCSTSRARPSVTSMVIKINNGNRADREQKQINVTEREDKTFENSFSGSIPVTRSDNGKRVSCEAIWSSLEEENTTISSNKETLRVVWPVDTPMNFRVEAWAESCIVTWTRDPNTNNVTVCHNSASSLTNCVKEKENSYIISGLTPDAEYSVWVYASNELGSSNSTAEKMCTPLAITITSATMATTATTASTVKEVCLNIGIVGGAGGGALGLIITVNIIVIACFVRRKPKESIGDHTYVNMDRWKKSPQLSASQSATNAEETL